MTAAIADYAGSATDPLVTLSYLKNTFMPGITSRAATSAQSKLSSSYQTKADNIASEHNRVMSEATKSGIASAVADKIAQKVSEKTGFGSSSDFTEIALKKGDKVTGTVGTGLMLKSGSATLSGPSGGVIINISVGATRKPGAATAANVYYMLVANDGTGMEVTSDTAVICAKDGYRVEKAYSSQYDNIARALYTMKLFLGTPTAGFDLERAATRVEALVMLIRLLGEEDEALSYKGTHPFTDVPTWADGYVAYAYNKGYTNGTSKNLYSSSVSATREHYITFILRALGYDDAAGDFSWDKSPTFAVSAGVITQSDLNGALSGVFYRDQVVYVSYKALSARLKGSNMTLAQKLISNGVITSAQLAEAKKQAGF